MLLVIRGDANLLSALFDHFKYQTELLACLCEARNNDNETAWSLAFKDPQKDIVDVLIKNIPKTSIFCKNILPDRDSVKPYLPLLFNEFKTSEVATNQTLLLALIQQYQDVQDRFFRSSVLSLVIEALTLFVSRRQECNDFLNQIDQRTKNIIFLQANTISSAGVFELLLNETELEQQSESEPSNTSSLQSFVRGKIDIFAVEQSTQPPILMGACYFKNIDAVVFLIKEVRKQKGDGGVFSFVNQTDKNGNTALHWASEVNASACADELLLNGYANCRATNHNGDTPLLIAVRNNHVNMIRILLARGSREIVLINNDAGENVISFINNDPKKERLRILFSDVINNLGPQSFLDVCKLGNTNKIISQLETTNFSRQVALLDADGNNCLMILVIHGHVGAIVALFDALKNEQDILICLCEAENEHEKTAWSLALAAQNEKVIKVLLEYMPKTDKFYENILPNNMQVDDVSGLKRIVKSMSNQNMASELLGRIEALEQKRSAQTQSSSSESCIDINAASVPSTARFYGDKCQANQANVGSNKRARL